jgi:MFS transporter, ACS family, hexuronate transporter
MIAHASPFARVRWSVALAAAFALTTSSIDRHALAVLAPAVRQDLGINHRGFGALVGAFSIAFLLGAPFGSRLVDRLGPRRALALSLVVWSVVSALHGMASSLIALLLLRVLLGASEAPSLPGAARAIRRVLPPGSRTAGYSLLFSGTSLGAIVGPPLIIGLKLSFGWQMSFVVISLLGLLWLPLWFAATKDSKDLRGYAEPQQRAIDVSWAEVLAQPAVRRALVLVLATAPALGFINSWTPQLLVERFYEAPNDLWRYLWLPPLCFEVGAIAFSGFARERAGALRGLVVIGGLMMAALAAIPYVDAAMPATLLAGVSMAGAGAIHVLVTTDLLARVPAPMASRAGASILGAQSLVYAVTSPLIGYVIDARQSYIPVLLAGGILAVFGGIVWALWPSRAVKNNVG